MSYGLPCSIRFHRSGDTEPAIAIGVSMTVNFKMPPNSLESEYFECDNALMFLTDEF